MVKLLCTAIGDFLWQFFGEPKHYYDDYPIGYIIRSEATHFLSSAFTGLLVSYLIWTILSRLYPKAQDHYIFRISFLLGLFAAVSVHIILDAYTEIC